jgi:hypothetical protein
MTRRVYRSTEEQTRYLLQRGLELYRRRIRARVSRLIREFLRVERLPRRLTFRDVEAVLEAVFKGRTRVPFMYQWTMRFRGRWLAVKWAWYLRTKSYWRERLEELYKGLQEYRRQLALVREGDVWWVLGRLSGWADSYDATEPEVCTAVKALGPVGEAVRFFRRITVWDHFLRVAVAVARNWPNRRYRVILALHDRHPIADREADRGGVYVRDFGAGRKKYAVYSFRVYGKDLPELVRTFKDDIMVLQLWTIDPPPIAPECEAP